MLVTAAWSGASQKPVGRPFAPASGSSLVRRNGKPVLSTTELNSGDRLEIGSGTYIFVPLCGEGFQW